jgi:SAM-dependent methyltransferase
MSSTNDFGRSLPIGAHHYRAYVGPPEKFDLVAAMQFNLMTYLGLREFHYLLDVGCGSLRAGRLFIPYLLPRHYYGIEPEAWLIEEGIQNELGRDILQIKQPVFSHDSNFDCLRFNQRFDFVLAQSVFSHASQLQIKECLVKVEQCLHPSGVVAATFVKGTVNYQGENWVYPDCVSYTIGQMKRLVTAVGLTAEPLDWPHPNGQTWLLIKRGG